MHFTKTLITGSIIALIFATFTMYGCSVSTVELDSGMTIAWDGQWTAADSQVVAEEIMTRALEGDWLENYTPPEERDTQAGPVVVAGGFVSNSSQEIDTGGFTEDIEWELVNSDRIRFVASPDDWKKLRSKRQQVLNDNPGQKATEAMIDFAGENGIDFLLEGELDSSSDTRTIYGEEQDIITYHISLEVVEVSTGDVVWHGKKQIIQRAAGIHGRQSK